MSQHLPRLLLIADQHRERTGALAAAVGAGADFVQIRDKNLDDEAVLQRLQLVREARRRDDQNPATAQQKERSPAGLICINGRPALARTEAIGLHLPAAGVCCGREGIMLLGRSAHDSDEVRQAKVDGVDYLIVGTVFPTASKPGRAALGMDGLAELTALAAPLPVFAIGGITPARVPLVQAAGAYGVAVCSAILAVADPAAATRQFLLELNP